MPELPEVETVKNGLSQKLLNQTIASVTLGRPNLRMPFPTDFCERLSNRTLTVFNRRSKYLLISLDDDTIWISHLGMSGKFTIEENPNTPLIKHDHVVIHFTNGTRLIYNDPRRFGFMQLTTPDELDTHPLFIHLGPEPLSNHFHDAHLYEKLHTRSVPIKNAIMNAANVVGVGNIYAAESLFRSHINPSTPCNKLKPSDYSILTQQIKQVLQDAITAGGSTLRDYRSADGDLGYFQHRFDVYNRENDPCHHCHDPIQRIVQQGRSSFFCPTCQPIKQKTA